MNLGEWKPVRRNTSRYLHDLEAFVEEFVPWSVSRGVLPALPDIDQGIRQAAEEIARRMVERVAKRRHGCASFEKSNKQSGGRNNGYAGRSPKSKPNSSRRRLNARLNAPYVMGFTTYEQCSQFEGVAQWKTPDRAAHAKTDPHRPRYFPLAARFAGVRKPVHGVNSFLPFTKSSEPSNPFSL